MKFSMSWTVTKYGKTSGGHESVSTWDNVSSRLNPITTHSGSASLDIVDAPSFGAHSVDLIADGGLYLITLLELNEDGLNVRDYTNPDVVFEMIELLGDMWDSRLLTDDCQLVYKLFKDFFDTGDVSCDWLQ